MSSPADLSKLRINRDAPAAPVRKALGRNLVIFVVALAVVAAAIVRAQGARRADRSGGRPPRADRHGGGIGGGATSVTANGYVVARTKASVSAKIAGRLAYLGVSEGSFVHRGDVIARLDNADSSPRSSQAQRERRVGATRA